MRTLAYTSSPKNIFLEIEYLGTNYFGFQIQNKKKKEITIQEVLENALKKLFCQDIRVIYSSRTDRGVHARAQAVNFKVCTKIPPLNIKTAINSLLPSDVRIKKVKEVSLDFHARFLNKSKVYRYTILNRKEPSVFWKDFCWHIKGDINIDLMRKTSKKLIGNRDFSLFAKEAKVYKNCQRNLKKIEIRKSGSFIYIDIEAQGFLRNMARNIVSFLVRIGTKKIVFKDIGLILNKRIPYANKPAPAYGLCLCKVKY